MAASKYFMERVRSRFYLLREMSGDRCCWCGGWFPAWMYVFHHVGHKTFTLSGGSLARKWAKVLAEWERCVMVCPNCHREIHHYLREV